MYPVHRPAIQEIANAFHAVTERLQRSGDTDCAVETYQQSLAMQMEEHLHHRKSSGIDFDASSMDVDHNRRVWRISITMRRLADALQSRQPAAISSDGKRTSSDPTIDTPSYLTNDSGSLETDDSGALERSCTVATAPIEECLPGTDHPRGKRDTTSPRVRVGTCARKCSAVPLQIERSHRQFGEEDREQMI